MFCDSSRGWGDADQFVPWKHMGYLGLSKGKMGIALTIFQFLLVGHLPSSPYFFADDSWIKKSQRLALSALLGESHLVPGVWMYPACLSLLCPCCLLPHAFLSLPRSLFCKNRLLVISESWIATTFLFPSVNPSWLLRLLNQKMSGKCL